MQVMTLSKQECHFPRVMLTWVQAGHTIDSDNEGLFLITGFDFYYVISRSELCWSVLIGFIGHIIFLSVPAVQIPRVSSTI